MLSVIIQKSKVTLTGGITFFHGQLEGDIILENQF